MPLTFFVKKVFFLSFLGNCAFKLYLLCIPSEILIPRLRKVSKPRNLESSCYTLTNFAVFLKYTLAGSQLASRLCYCSLSGRVSVPKVFLRRQLFIASNPINLWNVSSFGLCHRVTLFKVLVSFCSINTALWFYWYLLLQISFTLCLGWYLLSLWSQSVALGWCAHQVRCHHDSAAYGDHC